MGNTHASIQELNLRAWALCKKDGPQALQLAIQAQELLSDCPDAQPVDQFESLKTQTYCLDMLSKPGEALAIGLKAEQLAVQIGDLYLIGSIQSIIARVYWHIDDFPTAMSYYLKALKTVQGENHPDLEISLINGLGLVQYGLENYAESLGYFKTCLEKAAEDDLNRHADANNNVGYVLHMLGRNEEALQYDLAALVLFNQLGTSVGKMETMHSLGAIYFALGQYDQALLHLQEGIALARQANCELLELSYIIEISRIHQISGRIDQAEKEMLEALKTAEAIDSSTNISLIHERLVEIYKQKGDFKSALEHLEAFLAVYKKIFNDQSDRRVKNLEIQHQIEITRKQADLYRELAGTDFLTNLLNRRRFFEIVEDDYAKSEINKRRMAIIMADIDFFKSVNDIHGHKVGDEVLVSIATRIKKSMRQEDVAGRYGGEEFIIFIRDTTQDICVKIAERIRQAVEQQVIEIGQTSLTVTISLGVACMEPGMALPISGLINNADQALYLAKKQGRNRVVCWQENWIEKLPVQLQPPA